MNIGTRETLLKLNLSKDSFDLMYIKFSCSITFTWLWNLDNEI